MRSAPSLALLAALLLAGSGGAIHNEGSGTRSLGGADLPKSQPAMLRVEAEAFDEKPVGAPVADAGATGGTAWKMPEYGQISVRVSVPETGIVWLVVRARGEHPPGLLTTHMHPVVDGQQRGEWDVGPNWLEYRQSMPLHAGEHVLSVDNFNNYHAPAEDRTLVVDWVELSVPFLDGAPRAGGNVTARVDGPLIHEAGTGMARLDEPGARNATSWQMWGIGCFVELVLIDDAGRYPLAARLQGDAPGGTGSHVTMLVDNKSVADTFVGDEWRDVLVTFNASQGPAIIRICYDNDYGGDQKRNLRLDELVIGPLAERAPNVVPPTKTQPTTTTPPPTMTTPPPTSGAASTPPPAQTTPTFVPTEARAETPLPALAAALALALAATRRRAAALLVLLLAAPLAGASWPTAHGNHENHRAAPSVLTTENVAKLAEAWRYAARGSITGTPVHHEGVVYFGDWGGHVHAVDAQNGSRIWRVDHGARVDASLAVAGARVLVPDGTGNLSALDRASGARLWRTWIEPVRGAHLWGSPAVHDGRAYIGVASEQTDLEYEGPQDFRGSVAALDVETGKVLWKTYTQRADGRGVSVWSTPALDPALGLVFVGTGNAYGEPAGDMSDSIVALRMTDGSIAWSRQITKGDAFDGRGSPGPDADIGGSPLLFEADGRALVADGDKAGRFFALDRSTGEEVWQTKADFVAPNMTPGEKEGFLGTAAYANGTIFAPTTSRSMVHAIDAATGRVAWSRELNERPRSYGDRMFAPTTVTNGVVLQGNAFGQLHALDARDGAVLAIIHVGGDVQGGVSIDNGTVFVPDSGGVLWDPHGNLTAYRVAAGEPPIPVTSTPPTRPPVTTTRVSTTTPVAPPGEELPPVLVAAPAASADGAAVPAPAFWLVVTAAGAVAAIRRRHHAR